MNASACGSLEYALARLAARQGQRPDEGAWRRIEGLRGFAQALEEARRGPMRAWLVGITAESTPAQVEAVMRAQGRAMVEEIAGWMDPAWQPAIGWCVVWPDLAPLQHLARGHPPPAWMLDDARFKPLVEADSGTRAEGLADTEWAPLQHAWAEPEKLGSAWIAEWRRRLPRRALDDETLQELARALAQHAEAFGASTPGSGAPQRAALRARLVLFVRRAALKPAAVFAQLAITALDLERLRAELLRRAWFPAWKVA